jgi:hypothetical protein
MMLYCCKPPAVEQGSVAGLSRFSLMPMQYLPGHPRVVAPTYARECFADLALEAWA